MKYIDWIETVRHKNILPEDEIIIYGYSPEEIQKIAERFVKSGYPKVSVYLYFQDEWAANPDLPLQKLERFKNLVSAEWVNELISGRKPAEYENDNFVVVHSHYRNRDAYLSGHIPGAIDMDTLALEAPETWNRRSPEELEQALLHHGITADTTVILYGKFMFPDNDDEFPGSAAGDIGAIRNAFIMMYAGVKFVTIIGPSGCGKTTLLRLINGMTDFDSVRIVVMNKDIASWDKIQLRRSIGYAIQQGGLFPHLTVRQNIAFVLSISGISIQIIEDRVSDLANMMNFDDRQLNSFPSGLSGGQQQRVGVARALASQPEIVLMDEPLGALDNITRRKLQSELKEMHQKLGITFVMVTHDLHEAFTLGTHVVIMNEGKIEQFDTPELIREKPANMWVKNFIDFY